MRSRRARLPPLCACRMLGASLSVARKSPEHALCCCTCVSSRVPLGGFHNYIVIISNARDLRPDNSRSTLEFPEIAPSDLSALGNAGCAERNGHGDGSSVRLVDRASTVSSYGMGAAYQGSNSPEPAADTRILGRLALSEGTKSSRRAPLGKLFSRLVGRHGDF